MNESNRRELLTRLGAGAAVAAAALSLGGKASAAAPPAARAAAAVKLNAARAIELKIAAVRPGTTLAVKVFGTKAGFVIDAKPGDPGRVGVNEADRALNLGVTIKDGGVAIAGLDSIINRAASDGRCHANGLVDIVSNPDPTNVEINQRFQF